MALPIHSEQEVIGLDPEQYGDITFANHTVRPGESLSSIARHYFGDPSMARELAVYNSIDNPNSVQEGRRLRIPKKPNVLLRGGVPEPAPMTAATPTSPAASPSAAMSAVTYASYTIKSGDVLSRLSQKLLGTTKRMRELVELNKDVIKNPDRLIVGTVIKVPKD